MNSRSPSINLSRILNADAQRALETDHGADYSAIGEQLATAVMNRIGIWDSNEDTDLCVRENIADACREIRDFETMARGIRLLYGSAAALHVRLETGDFTYDYDEVRAGARERELESAMELGAM